MEYYSNLINSGFYRLTSNARPSADNAAVSTLVLGPGRSGTSLVAGVLYHLGVHAGDTAHAPVFEDVRLRQAVTHRDWSQVTAIATEYSGRYPNWSFKWTAGSEKQTKRFARWPGRSRREVAVLSRLYHSLGQPRVILTFKDVFAIANRNRISISASLLPEIRKAIEAYEIIARFIEKEQPEALLISADKAMVDKSALLNEVVEFCALQPTAQQSRAAMAFVEPNSPRYLVNTKSDRCIGTLAPLQQGKVAGWAKFKGSDDVATVALYIDDRKVACAQADRFRADLQGKVQSDGRCAFEFDQLDVASLPPGSVVRVRVEGDTQDLSNSPQRFTGCG